MCQQATLENVERIEPFVIALWKLLPKVSIPEQETAEEEAREITTPAIYMNVLVRNNLISIGIYWFGIDYVRPPNIPSEQIQYTLAMAEEMDIYTAELYAIWHALRRVYHLIIKKRCIFEVVIFSDSREAIQSLQSPGQ